MTEQTQPTDAPLNSIELMKVVMQADEETRAFALRGTTNWAAHIGKAVQNAVLAKWGTPAGAGEPEGWITWFRTSTGSREPIYSHGPKKPSHGAELDALLRKYPLYTTPQPTQAQAGAVPLTVQYPEGYGNPLAKIAYDAGWRAAEHAHGIKGADHA